MGLRFLTRHLGLLHPAPIFSLSSMAASSTTGTIDKVSSTLSIIIMACYIIIIIIMVCYTNRHAQ